MTPTKLELKHLAPYLPYGLKIDNLDNVLTCIDADYNTIWTKFRGHTNKLHKIDDIKPILRPLSDLTKEIEHNSERFVPIMRIFGGKNYNDYDYEIKIIERPFLGKRIDISVKGLGNPCISFSLSNVTNNILTHDCWCKLFEWHFDVFSLIERNLAIDINTL